MAKPGDEVFQLHRDQRLILDDEDRRGLLAFDIGDGLRDHLCNVLRRAVEDCGGFGRGEVLQRGQQQRLTRGRGNHAQPRLRPGLVFARRRAGRFRARGARPDLAERAVKRHTPPGEAGHESFVCEHGFEHLAHEGIPARLRPCERAGIAAQEGQVGRDLASEGHEAPFAWMCWSNRSRPIAVPRGIVAVIRQASGIPQFVPVFRYGKKILVGPGTGILDDHYPIVTAETPLPSKRLVIRSRKASVVPQRRPFFVGPFYPSPSGTDGEGPEKTIPTSARRSHIRG